MAVLFVVPDLRPDLHVHLGSIFEGVAYLSTYLKKAGFAVKLFAPRNLREAEGLEDAVAEAAPGLIGFSCTSSMFKYVRAWAPRVRQVAGDVPIICGGIHPTIAPEETIATEGIDMVCIGEGEHALVEVARAVQRGEPPSQVPGIWYRRDGKVNRNPRSVLHDFDGYDFPDLDLFNYKDSFYSRNRFAVVKLSRGCPYGCTYCCNPAIRKAYENSCNYVRFRSPRNAVDFVKELLRRYPELDTIAFLDDILFINRRWFSEFTALYRQEVGVPYACRGRVDLFTPAVAEQLKESNCYEITFGVESGNPEIRNGLLNRNVSDEQIVDAYAKAKAYGLTTRANNMIGVPGETVGTVFETIALNARLSYKTSLNSVFFPFKGSKLYDLCKREGLFRTEEVPDTPYRCDSVLKLPGITPLQIRYFVAWFDVLAAVFSRRPSWRKAIIRAHESWAFPYRLLLLTHEAYRQGSKLAYKVKNALRIRIKRYSSGK